MKKIMTLCLVATLMATTAQAQKGMQQVGGAVNWHMLLDYADNSLGPSVNYQYNITNHIRLSAAVGYNFAFSRPWNHYYDNYYIYDGICFGISGNFFFIKPEYRIRPYGIIGANAGQLSGENYREEIQTIFGFAPNAGVGCDFRLSYNFSMQIEGKVHAPLDNETFIIGGSLNFMYNF